MQSFQNPSERTSVLQLNSELENAHLELLSAHCAVHRLRLHYSPEELARFGRREVLRKSAQAATALRDFYAVLESKIAEDGPGPSVSHPRTEHITQAVEWITDYLREQREYYSPVASPLPNESKARMWPYFSAALLDRIRILELLGAHVREPEFFSRVRELGFEPPAITHMDSITFIDIVAFNQMLTERALVHALVHTVQMEILGLQRYVRLWVQGFLKTRTHYTVPLEVHAFSLSSKCMRSSTERFSVEDEVVRWVGDGRY